MCDGWSTNVILDELSRLYSALRAGQPAGLPQAPMSFATYAHSIAGRAFQRRHRTGSRAVLG